MCKEFIAASCKILKSVTMSSAHMSMCSKAIENMTTKRTVGIVSSYSENKVRKGRSDEYEALLVLKLRIEVDDIVHAMVVTPRSGKVLWEEDQHPRIS